MNNLFKLTKNINILTTKMHKRCIIIIYGVFHTTHFDYITNKSQ